MTSTNETINLHELLSERRSPKAYLDRGVEQEKIVSLFEAARWSPSSRNEQPWRFIVETKENVDGYGKILGTLTEKNKLWAREAPVLVAVIAKLRFDRNGKPNGVALYDTGGAVANLTTQAVANGLQVHQMGGFDRAQLANLYAIPDDFQPVVVLAVGYADEGELLQRERMRNPLENIVYEGNWENTAEVVE